MNADGTAKALGEDGKPSTTNSDIANAEPGQEGGDGDDPLGKINDVAGVAGIEGGAIDAASKYGIGAAEDLAGTVGKVSGGILTGIGAVGALISIAKGIQDLTQPKPDYKAAAIHFLDAAVGIAAIASVGTVAAPFIAAGAIIYGISRLYWVP